MLSVGSCSEVLDFDYNENNEVSLSATYWRASDSTEFQLIDEGDLPILRLFLKQNNTYDIKYDNNFDGIINQTDVRILCEHNGLNLNAIRKNIRTDKYVTLDWNEVSINWSCQLNALNPKFVTDNDWNDILYQNYWDWTKFRYYKVVCMQSSVDMGVCAYKDLGYGCIMPAGAWGHMYNIFWIGGDWHDLNNWVIFDPGAGRIMYQDNPYLCTQYKTKQIFFPMYREEYKGKSYIKYAILKVNFNKKTVAYYNRIEGTSLYLESAPDVFY